MSDKGGFLVAFGVVVFSSFQKSIETNARPFDTHEAMPIKTRPAAKDTSLSDYNQTACVKVSMSLLAECMDNSIKSLSSGT